ncbi:AMP-binding protein [Desulfuromonas thiophila]|uniref:Acetyl-CoA synthetase n=1 Tax=Desulfuromonas thiophila TaxID=57664 RepID=A0A1G7EXG3_9BACT|nr:AMP-binding protein [Desulfuromonas thiophila]SDE68126.1 acetyl-CoA synthetase [Desulfuromonas thiophila]
MISASSLNIATCCTQLQCDRGNAAKTALRWLAVDGTLRDYSFAELDQLSNRFANVLHPFALQPQSVIATLLPKCPEHFIAFLGTLKQGQICAPLFANLGDLALRDRLADSRARLLVTRKSQLKKILRHQQNLPDLRAILLTDSTEDLAPHILSYPKRLQQASIHFSALPTAATTPALLHYTSGSTGQPKGVLHVHGSLHQQRISVHEVLQLQPDDLYWCTADHGWITGSVYGIIAPWSEGIRQLHYGGGYAADRWCNILSQQQVSVWYTAPTALRLLMREPAEQLRLLHLPHLRHIFSVGEPLNPEILRWAQQTLGKEVYDTWFQTETGAIAIANRPGLTLRPGSMGKPVSGIEAAILDAAGQPVADGVPGDLCLHRSFGSLFTGYLNATAAYQAKFRGDYYCSGDCASRDAQGYYWFKGRTDDVINTGGHLVSPFEIESALLEVAEVAESAVVGIDDDLLYQKIVAFVQLHDGCPANRELEIRLRLHISNRVSTIATPQDLVFINQIPKNTSGKILRRLLRARYLGLPEGDLSTLDCP